MQVKPQITFRDVKHSEEVESYIHKKINKVEQFSSHIVSCQVVIKGNTHHNNSEDHFQTCVKIAVPRRELVSNQSQDNNLYKSIDGAFENIKRQLGDFENKMSSH